MREVGKEPGVDPSRHYKWVAWLISISVVWSELGSSLPLVSLLLLQ